MLGFSFTLLQGLCSRPCPSSCAAVLTFSGTEKNLRTCKPLGARASLLGAPGITSGLRQCWRAITGDQPEGLPNEVSSTSLLTEVEESQEKVRRMSKENVTKNSVTAVVSGRRSSDCTDSSGLPLLVRPSVRMLRIARRISLQLGSPSAHLGVEKRGCNSSTKNAYFQRSSCKNSYY